MKNKYLYVCVKIFYNMKCKCILSIDLPLFYTNHNSLNGNKFGKSKNLIHFIRWYEIFGQTIQHSWIPVDTILMG